MWIPFFGWCAAKAEMIPVDRGKRSQALAAMTERARDETAKGREIIIFPEGTRRAPGAEPKYKFGVAFLYTELGIPCVPVALNSGLFWPRRSFRRFPGVVRVEFLTRSRRVSTARYSMTGCRTRSRPRPRSLWRWGRSGSAPCALAR